MLENEGNKRTEEETKKIEEAIEKAALRTSDIGKALLQAGKISMISLVDATLVIEKLRVQAEVRQTHLFRNGLRELEKDGLITPDEMKSFLKKWDDSRHLPDLSLVLTDRLHDVETDELHKRILLLELYVDGRIADRVPSHPAYYWFSRVRGVGKENIAKVIALVNIRKANTISGLWKYCGYAPEDGHSARREPGVKLSYNSQLRSLCWRLAGSLRKADGCFYEYYSQQKERYVRRFTSEGIKVLPTPPGKWACVNCGQSWPRKVDIEFCCDNQTIQKVLRNEPEGVIWLGHLDAMAMRKMIKLFLACLWLTWREAEGLPLTKPYALDVLKHNSFIDPWTMVDRVGMVLAVYNQVGLLVAANLFMFALAVYHGVMLAKTLA